MNSCVKYLCYPVVYVIKCTRGQHKNSRKFIGGRPILGNYRVAIIEKVKTYDGSQRGPIQLFDSVIKDLSQNHQDINFELSQWSDEEKQKFIQDLLRGLPKESDV